jgi:hypothetical protein
MIKYLVLAVIVLETNSLLSQPWSPAGSGVNGTVNALEIYNGELYAGGIFDTAGGILAKNIAKWNGISWTAIGVGTNCQVTSLKAYNGRLYVGMISVTGDTNNRIVRWDGTNWSQVGLGITGGFGVQCMEVYNGELFAGGNFSKAGGTYVSGIVKWNDTTWSALGGGIPGPICSYVNALEVYNGDLYVGGSFSITLAGIPSDDICKWTGSSWLPVDSGLESYVNDMTVYNNELILGGDLFSSQNFDLASWNDTNLSGFHLSSSTALALHSYNGWLYFSETAVGAFYKWNGTFSNFGGSTVNSNVRAIIDYNNEIYIGGDFTTSGGLPLNHIGHWPSALSAIETQELKSPVCIYPNPSGGNFKIKFSEKGNYAITVLNTLGQVKYQTDFKNFEPYNENILQISFPEKGIHFINVTGNNQSFARKIIFY